MVNKSLVRFALISMAIAVIFGAMGAHALKKVLTEQSLESFETGVRYQLIHSLALLCLTALHSYWTSGFFRLVTNIMAIGMVLFSGSIYLLSTQSITGLSVGFLGPVTPLGGLLMISAWILLGFRMVKGK